MNIFLQVYEFADFIGTKHKYSALNRVNELFLNSDRVQQTVEDLSNKQDCLLENQHEIKKIASRTKSSACAIKS